MDKWNEFRQKLQDWFSEENLERLFARENLMRWLPIAIPCVVLPVALIILLSAFGARSTPGEDLEPPSQPGLKPVYRDIRAEEVQGEVRLTRGGEEIYPVSYGLVISDGDSVTVGSDGNFRISLDGDKTLYGEENTVFRLDASGRLGSTQTNIYLTGGGVLCRLSNPLKNGETFSVETPTGTVSAQQSVTRCSVLPGAVNYTMVQVFSGTASVTVKDTGAKLTLYSGQCVLIKNSEGFVLDDELAASFWRGDRDWDGTVSTGGSGRSTLAIPYEKLPSGTVHELLSITGENQQLILDQETLENLLETGHDYRQTVITAPSCVESGRSRYHCALCGDAYEADTPATGHTPVVDPGIEATCTKAGRTDGSHCSVCNAIIQAQQTIEPLGHTLVIQEAVEVTCTEDGFTEGRYCTTCGLVLAEQTRIPKTGHTVVIDAAVEPTCYSVGYTQGSHCSKCGQVITERKTLEKTEHTPVTDPARDPTCAQEGLTEGSHCSVCGEVLKKQESIPRKEHTPVIDPAVEATCAQEGLTEGSHCSVCGEVLKKQEIIPMKEHTPVTDPGREATCAQEGLTEGSHCSVCGTVLQKQNAIPKTEHTPVEETVILEDGSTQTILRCSVCGAVLN